MKRCNRLTRTQRLTLGRHHRHVVQWNCGLGWTAAWRGHETTPPDPQHTLPFSMCSTTLHLRLWLRNTGATAAVDFPPALHMSSYPMLEYLSPKMFAMFTTPLYHSTRCPACSGRLASLVMLATTDADTETWVTHNAGLSLPVRGARGCVCGPGVSTRCKGQHLS